jgi:MFS family permease
MRLNSANLQGYTSVQAQLLSIGPYASAFTFTMIVAYLADHYHHRYSWCVLGTIVSMIGYIIIMAVPERLPGVLYFATFLMITGAYITQPLILTWSQNNQAGHYKRAVSSAWTVSFGNISGIIASTIYTTPPFTRPYGAGLALMFCCFLFSTGYYFGLKRENKKRDRGERDYRLQYSREKLMNIGDDHPSFRFAL